MSKYKDEAKFYKERSDTGNGMRVKCNFLNREEECEDYEPSGEDIERKEK